MPVENRLAHVFELFTVFLVFPAVVYWGAQAKERFPQLGFALGNASYGAYAIHIPMLYIGLFVLAGPHPLAANYKLSFLATLPWALAFCLAVGVSASLIDLCLDRPLRKWLSRRLAAPQSSLQDR